jgi:hypothetical protein
VSLAASPAPKRTRAAVRGAAASGAITKFFAARDEVIVIDD